MLFWRRILVEVRVLARNVWVGSLGGPQGPSLVCAVNVVSVTGRGPLGLMVSPARQVGEQELGLKVDDLAEGVERPELDQVRPRPH
jgi:hypothetical protein